MRSKRVTGDGSLGRRNAKSTRNAPPHLAAAVALAVGWCLVSGLSLSRSVSQIGNSAILRLFFFPSRRRSSGGEMENKTAAFD